MLTYWETLTAIQSNVSVNDSYAQLWGRKSQGGYAVVTYTGTLPATLTGTKAGYLHRYKIYGNTEQIGTPTPENPIVPSECGELETTGIHAGQYKLHLTSAGQNANIYLGESQTTRRIKKLVLTGHENWLKRTGSPPNVFFIEFYSTNFIGNKALCTHYINQDSTSFDGIEDKHCLVFLSSDGIRSYIGIRDSSYVAAINFKNYLIQQYAAGTPVTVWYVRATEETGTLNEPLRKIGNYADTIDSTQTSAQIPTSAGATAISWAGEGLAPSKVELEYKKKG